MPVKADRVAYPARHHVRTAAIEADAPYLPIGLRWLADITRRADIDIKLVVRPQAHELPAVRLMIEKIVVDDHGLWWVVEVVLDLFKLGNLGTFGDVERAIVESKTIRPVQAGSNHFCLTFPIPVDDRKNFFEDAVAHENSS